MNENVILWGTLAGLATGFATLVGALPVLLSRRSIDSSQNVLLGFAAGVMMSASYLSLIVPAAGYARDIGLGAFSAAGMVAISVLIGAGSLHALRRSGSWGTVRLGDAHVPADVHRRAWLLVVAMTSHNLPEGAAVGVGFGAEDPTIGLSTAIGIGVQNLPEGLAVAAALLTVGCSRRKAILLSGATGIVEPVGAFLGVTLVTLATGFLPAAMGWAAGAMLYIVAAELIPAIHANGNTNRAVASLLAGLSAMLFLDIALA